LYDVKFDISKYRPTSPKLFVSFLC